MGAAFPKSLNVILDMRKDTDAAYSSFFCLHMLTPVVTARVWKALNSIELLSYQKFVTISDEAFALLVLENNWDLWIAYAKV